MIGSILVMALHALVVTGVKVSQRVAAAEGVARTDLGRTGRTVSSVCRGGKVRGDVTPRCILLERCAFDASSGQCRSEPGG